MTFISKKTAIILFNLGGPDKPESVKPFLFNLFNDKAIIGLPQPFRYLLAKLISGKRYKTAQEIYGNIGGKSPLLDLTIDQAHNLEKELSFHGDFKTFIAMRYWKPFSFETIEKVIKYNPDNIILLPLYPQLSSSTSKSSIDDFNKIFNKNRQKFKQDLQIKTICCYPTEENFIKSHSLLIKKTISRYKNLDQLRFLFSAHGLPEKLIKQGDPYVFQVESTTNKVVESLADLLSIKKSEISDKIDYKVCYQSKVGPLKWTSPSLDSELRRAAIDKKIPVITPIAFVSDHSETLVELDIEYKEMAEELGIKKYLRTPALNSDGLFIKSLSAMCLNAKNNFDKKLSPFFCNTDQKRICPKKFKYCPNNNI